MLSKPATEMNMIMIMIAEDGLDNLKDGDGLDKTKIRLHLTDP